ncbi:hypothetical protein T484DRAFT_2748758 [Baffinella frigidus]|nr:hypothetical protein T484DRAFT_2748758 [Cryptophyta sp. CCMP2293]
MFAKAFVFASALVGAEAFAAFGASPALGLRKAPTAGMSTRTAPSQTVVMGTFMEEFKFRKVANRFTFKTFADCIAAAGMEGELAKGGTTVFAPTDAAFEELGAEVPTPNP